ncbi:hypothetical protein ABH926_003432 [Catenulispora sp. GP43]|uniref:MauE/DoxX family redox-associated membrane protein n=1 Tax=Catenulispora sp. GP43 TaxID=3156263 RepID=UPI003514EBC4
MDLVTSAARVLIGLVFLAAVVDKARDVRGFALAVVLDAGFLAVIVRVLRSGTSAACMCFGGTQREFGIRHVARDVLLGAVALIGLAGTAGAHQEGGAGVSAPAWALSAVTGVLGAGVLVLLDEIVDLYAG